MKEAKKVQITEQICRQAQLMRKGGANQAQVAELLGINNSTVSRIEAAGFSLEQYIQNRKARRAKEMEKASKAEEPPAEEPEQIEGQLEMDLTITKPDMSEQVKMMRFQAAQVDKLIMKLDQIYNMASMILRAVRKE